MAASVYYFISEEVENYIFRHNWILKHTCMYKKPALTKYWNYNLFVQILYSHFRYTNRLFLGCVFLLLAVILSELQEKPRRKVCVTKKNYTQEFVWGTSFFWLHALRSICHFLLPSSSILTPSQVKYLMNSPYKDT